MTVQPRFEGASPIGPLPPAGSFLDDVWTGLSQNPKKLPAKYFYDAAGSALFERITALPEYYPTRAELSILDRHGIAIAASLPPQASLVEFGSGSSVKLRRLLERAGDLSAYVPVDVSGSFLREQAEALREDFSGLKIHPVVADFTKPLTLPEAVEGHRLAGYFSGSTIGNFEPEEARRLLVQFGNVLGAGATLIVGVDLVKDREILEAAYDDAAGITAAFNLNVLARINRELSGEFDLDAFAHRAFWNAVQSRIEMHLVSRTSQEASIAGRRFRFRAGETIHTENSYKYTLSGFADLAAQAGWSAGEAWTDPAGLFSVHALRREG